MSKGPATSSRRPAGDLIDAIVRNMRENCETLRYSTVAPSRYSVYLSATEYARLEGLLPRLRTEAIRALDEELSRKNRRAHRLRLVTQWLRPTPPVQNADEHWHIEFLPDMDGDLKNDHDIVVHSDLILPATPELGGGARTRRLTTVHSGHQTTSHTETRARTGDSTHGAPASPRVEYARLRYEDRSGPHTYAIVRPSTTIGRGGTMYPVDVRIATDDDVSREHARIRRDESSGAFFLIDLSTHGTTINGQAVPRGVDDADGGKRENGAESPLPSKATIGLADTVVIEFETL